MEDGGFIRLVFGYGYGCREGLVMRWFVDRHRRRKGEGGIGAGGGGFWLW